MRTYEELLAAQTELAHFNKNHDPKTGQFASGNGTNSRRSVKDKPGTIEDARKKGLVKKPDRIEKTKDDASSEKKKMSRTTKILIAGGLTGVALGGAIAAAIATGGLGAVPMAGFATSLGETIGATALGSYAGGISGLSISSIADALIKNGLKNASGFVSANGSTPISSYNYSSQESMRMAQQASNLAIQEANRAMSLSITGGTNPFLFG